MKKAKNKNKMQKRYDVTLLLLFFCGIGFSKARHALSNINNQQSYHSITNDIHLWRLPSSLNLFTNKHSATYNTCSRCQRCNSGSHTESQAFHSFIMWMYHIDLFPNDPQLEMNFLCTVHNNYTSIFLTIYPSILSIYLDLVYIYTISLNDKRPVQRYEITFNWQEGKKRQPAQLSYVKVRWYLGLSEAGGRNDVYSTIL